MPERKLTQKQTQYTNSAKFVDTELDGGEIVKDTSFIFDNSIIYDKSAFQHCTIFLRHFSDKYFYFLNGDTYNVSEIAVDGTTKNANVGRLTDTVNITADPRNIYTTDGIEANGKVLVYSFTKKLQQRKLFIEYTVPQNSAGAFLGIATNGKEFAMLFSFGNTANDLQTIIIFDMAGKQISTHTGGLPFDDIQTITMDPAGDLFALQELNVGYGIWEYQKSTGYKVRSQSTPEINLTTFGINTPRGITNDGGYVYVYNADDKSLHSFDLTNLATHATKFTFANSFGVQDIAFSGDPTDIIIKVKSTFKIFDDVNELTDDDFTETEIAKITLTLNNNSDLYELLDLHRAKTALMIELRTAVVNTTPLLHGYVQFW